VLLQMEVEETMKETVGLDQIRWTNYFAT